METNSEMDARIGVLVRMGQRVYYAVIDGEYMERTNWRDLQWDIACKAYK